MKNCPKTAKIDDFISIFMLNGGLFFMLMRRPPLYSGEQNNGHNTAKQITGTMTHNQITGSETKRPFVLNKELSQDSNLLVMMKNFYNMHDVYFMNILKAVFRNTARFIPDFPMVEDNFYEHISYIIYTRYHLFITYMQIVVSYDGEFVYFPPNGVWKISRVGVGSY